MKKFIKLLAASLTLILLCAVPPMGAFAAKGDVVPKSIDIYYNNRKISSGNVRVTVIREEGLQLEFRISPEDADVSTDVTWRSSSTRVAEVDSDGYIDALESGTSTVTVRTANGRSASCVIYVPKNGGTTGRVENTTDSRYSSSTDSRDSNLSSSTAKANDTVKLTEQVPREVLLNAARLGNDGKPASLRGYESVSPETLGVTAQLGNFAVNYETMLGDTVVGRVTFAPDIAAGTSNLIKLGVYSKTGNTASVQSTFDTYYANAPVVIFCEQGVFPAPVEISARIGSLNGNNLNFSSYDKSRNSVSDLTVTSARKDSSNYVHFTTTTGGYIVVSDGPLRYKNATSSVSGSSGAPSSISGSSGTPSQLSSVSAQNGASDTGTYNRPTGGNPYIVSTERSPGATILGLAVAAWLAALTLLVFVLSQRRGACSHRGISQGTRGGAS